MSTPGEVYVSNPLVPAAGQKVIVDDGGTDGAIDLADLLHIFAETRIISAATDTLLATDTGKTLIYTAAGGCAITCPDTLVEKFHCSIIAAGAVVPAVTPDTDTINGAGAAVSPSAQYKAMYLVKYTATALLAIL